MLKETSFFFWIVHKNAIFIIAKKNEAIWKLIYVRRKKQFVAVFMFLFSLPSLWLCLPTMFVKLMLFGIIASISVSCISTTKEIESSEIQILRFVIRYFRRRPSPSSFFPFIFLVIRLTINVATFIWPIASLEQRFCTCRCANVLGWYLIFAVVRSLKAPGAASTLLRIFKIKCDTKSLEWQCAEFVLWKDTQLRFFRDAWPFKIASRSRCFVFFTISLIPMTKSLQVLNFRNLPTLIDLFFPKWWWKKMHSI